MTARAARSVVDALDVRNERTVKAVTHALGEELRRARVARGLSRECLVTLLPSGIGARTLLSYEHGTRQFTVLRFLELCRALGASAPNLLGLALQRARIHLDSSELWVDLHALLADNSTQFRPVILWARNKLIECPGGVVEIAPVAVHEMATMIGCAHRELANYFARFAPDLEQITKTEDDRSLAAT